MRTMDRREFLKDCGRYVTASGLFILANPFFPSISLSKEVTPNPSLVDRLDWVPQTEATKIASDYDNGIAIPEKQILSALFSLLAPDNTSFSEIPRQVGMLRDFQLEEIQEIPREKIAGLHNLVQLRQQYPGKFEETFGTMLKTGDSPEDIINNGLPVKTFNPYAEALYWLALDGKDSYAESMVNNFDPNMLLVCAWAKPDTRTEKKIFKERWGKLSVVDERMSIPLGINRYFNRFYKYEEGAPDGSTSRTFSRKRGQCQDLAELGKRFLSYNCFNVFIRCVVFPGNYNYHTGSGIDLGPGAYMDKRYSLVVDFDSSRNKISGPHTESQLDLRLARGRPIVNKMWHGWS